MSRKTQNRNRGERRILGRVEPEDFIGRAVELERIMGLAAPGPRSRGLLVLAAPATGVSELLRQAYDELFRRHAGDIVPIYFQFSAEDKTTAAAARRFLHTFVQQLAAWRRNDPSQLEALQPLAELAEQVAPADYEWVEQLIEMVERSRDDERALVRLCLGAPQRAAAHGARALVMLDGIHLTERLKGETRLGAELAQLFMRSDQPFVLAGLRRRLLDLVRYEGDGSESTRTLRLEKLPDREARALVERLAERAAIALNDETRDLIVQQLGGKPAFMTSLLQSAREKEIPLTNFLNCQQLYVDELMGGRLYRHFDSVMETITGVVAPRRALIRVLYESKASDGSRAQVETWRKRLGVEPAQLQQIIRELHINELASLNANFIEVGNGSYAWSDYLSTRYRMEVAAEPRALVVAETLLETLKRAPHTMARHYRRAAALGLRELLTRFDGQRVPASLLHYDRFSRAYKGLDAEAMAAGLDAETDLVRLPQVVHAASCAAFYPPMQAVCDEERCAVAPGFDAGTYTDANEVVWIAAEIESKLEAGRGITEVWCDRLLSVARACGFNRVRLWLVAPEGFSAEAMELLAEREAYGSSRHQLELLTARISPDAAALAAGGEESTDEFELVIPMGEDTELIAATTVDQIARRINFQPEAINQIKTALVEACINAAEHSLSPDRKIYQRFRLESDKLVVTVSSRGVVPVNFSEQNGDKGRALRHNGNEEQGARNSSSGERRGWGLTLIKTLMDEVEFERVDDGTRLRMTKYLRRP
ncbi:MAG TPA: ATP-binding protein [Pyrinomonadaceae bacterium]|jgi:serine/threonine-protein kinase RsbW|nr:ATP-binding protein [Pyrinomonadaceae bacterium]